MTDEELTKIIAAIPVYGDEHYSLREYQDAKVTVMTMIENYNKLKAEYAKLKEAVGKVKAYLDSRRTAFTIKETYEEGRNVGLAIALETIDVYTEGLT